MQCPPPYLLESLCLLSLHVLFGESIHIINLVQLVYPSVALLAELVFLLLCIAGAIRMTAFCIKKYLDDTSVVSIDNNRRFHDNPDYVYPSISIFLWEGLFVDTNFVKGSILEIW